MVKYNKLLNKKFIQQHSNKTKNVFTPIFFRINKGFIFIKKSKPKLFEKYKY